jgi:putative Ca2+/H+ antiporter (TMEM165/GDT1 family)
VDPYIVLATIPVIFIGELPDTTMFASLVLATKGRPRQVWIGARCAHHPAGCVSRRMATERWKTTCAKRVADDTRLSSLSI